MWNEVLYPQSKKTEHNVRAKDIKHQFRKLVISHLIDQNSMALIDSKKEYNYGQFLQNLDNYKKKATQEGKDQLFDFFVYFFLTHDYSNIIDKYTNQNKDNDRPYPQRQHHQTRLFGSEQSMSGVSQMMLDVSKNPNMDNQPSFFEQTLNRIFFKLNFFSERYISSFIEICEDLLNKKKHEQSTLSTYISENLPQLLKDPLGSRISDFIHRTGEEFLDGIAKIDSEKIDAPHFKILLHEFLLSSHGNKIFPSWVGALNFEVKKQIVEELIKP